jgi:hypothetical protein
MLSVSPRCALLRCIAIAVFLVIHCAISHAQDTLRNENIVEMTKAGIDENTMLKLIQSRLSSFDTSVQALVRLKQAGVSDTVIDAIVSARRADAGAAGLHDIPDEAGVYANVRERLVPLKIEIVTWRTGGELKRLYGNRGHLNGVVSRPLSTLDVDTRPEFIVKTPDGVAAEEYQLVRFWKKEDRREFRIVTGGVFHATSGPDDNLVAVDIERVGPRTYRMRPSLPLRNGEYGFLAPAAGATATVASSGKMYTFRVDEVR